MLERFQNGFEHPKLCTIEFLPIFGLFWSLVGPLSYCFFRVFRRFFFIAPSFARSTFQLRDPSVECSFPLRTYKPHLVYE